MKTIKIGTIKGRHPLPVEKYIINEEVNFEEAHIVAKKAMTEFLQETEKDSTIDLYITGLTRVTLACIVAFMQIQGDHDFSGNRLSKRSLRIWEYNSQKEEYETVQEFQHASGYSDTALYEYGLTAAY